MDVIVVNSNGEDFCFRCDSFQSAITRGRSVIITLTDGQVLHVNTTSTKRAHEVWMDVVDRVTSRK